MSKRVLSGVQPTGKLTLGNFLGALKNFSKYSKEYETFYCVADLHSITLRREPKTIRENTLKLIAFYLAAGLHPDKDTIFIQSQIPQHAELAWILSCNTYMGEMSRMTQYKDKSKNLAGSIPVGLFNYPILMAADILLYQSDLVPVGDDQRQHLEITRDIAQRFNQAYSPTFVVPQGLYNKDGARIFDLQEPTKKMSKSSESLAGVILLEDDEKTIRRKISRAVTDSIGKVNLSDDQPGIKNLLTIHSLCKEQSLEESYQALKNASYKDLKDAVSDAVVETLLPFQEAFFSYYKDKAFLEKAYNQGAQRAFKEARKTLDKVKRKVGFVRR